MILKGMERSPRGISNTKVVATVAAASSFSIARSS